MSNLLSYLAVQRTMGTIMHHIHLRSTVLATATGLASLAWADDTSLTIYSSAQPGSISADLYRPVPEQSGYENRYRPQIPGYATIRSDRMIELKAGRQTLRFDDVAAYLDPTTVAFSSLTDPAGTSVLEQNYQFDLVSAEKLMQRYIGKEIHIERQLADRFEVSKGVLLSSRGGEVILDQSDGTAWHGYMILPYSRDAIKLPNPPAGLVTRPTLVWDVQAAKPGPHNVRVSYQTENSTWWADYNITFTEGSDSSRGTLDMSTWVSIINSSGASYNDAKLKLIAGDVNRQPRSPASFSGQSPFRDSGESSNAFQEKTFFEYHMYTLGRPTTLPDNSTKQIELFPAAHGIQCDRVLVYDAMGHQVPHSGEPIAENRAIQAATHATVYLRFVNSEANHLGMPLPGGRIRLNKLDPADQTMEFIGEDVIAHTPRDETVTILAGSSFDVVGDRKQTAYAIDPVKQVITETIELSLRNRKQTAIEMIAREHMYRWVNWSIENASVKPDKVSGQVAEFPVKLEAGQELTISYTVKYTW
ncbi:MAG: DUF4139 domain-containing protein [Planctomycetota bacterium]|nr:DUF4139 domain-containing protein [Planctomycetota bacterium]